MIEGDAILFARLLQGAQALQFGLEADDLLRQSVEAGQHLIERRLAALQLHREFAGLALHGQRTGPALLAAGHGLAVIAGAVGQEEIEVRIADRQALGGGAVLGQKTHGDARHQVDGAILEAVGEAERIAEARG